MHSFRKPRSEGIQLKESILLREGGQAISKSATLPARDEEGRSSPRTVREISCYLFAYTTISSINCRSEGREVLLTPYKERPYTGAACITFRRIFYEKHKTDVLFQKGVVSINVMYFPKHGNKTTCQASMEGP